MPSPRETAVSCGRAFGLACGLVAAGVAIDRGSNWAVAGGVGVFAFLAAGTALALALIFAQGGE